MASARTRRFWNGVSFGSAGEIELTLVPAELDVCEQADLDDLPQQAQHQMRLSFAQIQSADVHHVAADSWSRVQRQVEVLLRGGGGGIRDWVRNAGSDTSVIYNSEKKLKLYYTTMHWNAIVICLELPSRQHFIYLFIYLLTQRLSLNNLLNNDCGHRNNAATQTCAVNGVSFFLFIVLSSIVSGTDRLIILLIGEQTRFQISSLNKKKGNRTIRYVNDHLTGLTTARCHRLQPWRGCLWWGSLAARVCSPGLSPRQYWSS